MSDRIEIPIKQGTETICFSLKDKQVYINHYRSRQLVMPQAIAFNTLERIGSKFALVLPYKDGTTLKFDLPERLEEGETVTFEFEKVGDGLKNMQLVDMGDTATSSTWSGTFELDEDYLPTIALNFSYEFPNPALPFSVERTTEFREERLKPKEKLVEKPKEGEAKTVKEASELPDEDKGKLAEALEWKRRKEALRHIQKLIEEHDLKERDDLKVLLRQPIKVPLDVKGKEAKAKPSRSRKRPAPPNSKS